MVLSLCSFSKQLKQCIFIIVLSIRQATENVSLFINYNVCVFEYVYWISGSLKLFIIGKRERCSHKL